MKYSTFLGAVLLVSAPGMGQDASRRAWQQRLDLDMALTIPIVGIEAANPFASVVDQPPVLTGATAPRKLPVAGRAKVAAYIDASGDCLGIVPLRVPFQGVTSTLVSAFANGKFEPARVGKREVPSWLIVEVGLEGKVKGSSVIATLLEMPDPARPPQPSAGEALSTPGRLVGLPATPPEGQSTGATLKRLKVKVPGREVEVPVRALVHVRADGRCDSFVPLEIDDGLQSWFSTFLGTWRMQPGQSAGAPVDCWVVYTARVRLDLSSLQSTAVSVVRGETYDP